MHQVDALAWLFVLALDVHESKSPEALAIRTRLQRAERFTNLAAPGAAMKRDQCIGLVVAERLRECQLFVRSSARRIHIGRAEMLDQPLRELLACSSAGVFIRLDDLHQRR